MTKQTAQSSSWPFNSPALSPAADVLAEERRSMVARLHRSYLNLVAEMAPLQAAWEAGQEDAFMRAAAAGWQLGAEWRADEAPLFDASFWEGLAVIDANAHSPAFDVPASAPALKPGERLVRQRNAVLAMPSLLASGDKAGISRHVASVLRAFDPAYVEDIVGDEQFGDIVDALGQDPSVRAYMAYVGLLVSAVPPNFYAFVAGKGAPCLMLEAVVLAFSALISASNATAVRIWEIEERFDDLDMDETASRAELNIDEAAAALVRMLDDFRRAADDVHDILDMVAASGGKVTADDGEHRSVAAEMAAIVADTSCRDCGSSDHTTTLSRMGTINYE